MKPQHLFYSILSAFLILFLISCKKEQLPIPEITSSMAPYSQLERIAEPQFQEHSASAHSIQVSSLAQDYKSIGSGKFNLERPFNRDEFANDKVNKPFDRKSRKSRPAKKNSVSGTGVVRLSSSLYDAEISLSVEERGNPMHGLLIMTQTESQQTDSLRLMQSKEVYLDDFFGAGEEMVLELEGTPASQSEGDVVSPTMILYFAHGNLFFDNQVSSFGSSLVIRKNTGNLTDR